MARIHHCHLPGCRVECPPRHLYCAEHWRMVPPDLKEAVYETARRRGKAVDETWADWWRAQAQAEAAVLRQLGGEEDQIARKLRREMAFAQTLEDRAIRKANQASQLGLDLDDTE